MRCFLFDDARTCSTVETVKKSIDFAASQQITRVIWHLTDDQGCRVKFRSVPGIGSYPSFTVNETKAIVSFAERAGVTIIPEIASLGHSRYITRLPRYRHLSEHEGVYSGLCPVHPDTRPLLAGLIREAIELFGAPALHVGMDEVDIGPHRLTQAALEHKSKPQLIAEHLQFLRQLIVDEGGREMWMWGDGLLASPELMQLTPKDIVICNWQYRPTADASSTQRLLDAGFEVITASALLSHDQTLFPSSRYALQNVQALQSHAALRGATGDRKVRGHIITTWIPARSIGEAQWLGWHLAAEILQHGSADDREGSIRSFGSEFYGLKQTDEWLDVCQTLLNLAPERAEWMAVVKLQLTGSAVSLALLPEVAGAWRSAADRLHALRSSVRQNGAAFDAFQLLLDLLAHAYTAAATISDIKLDAESAALHLRELFDARVALLERLSDAWDRERFADDPAKTEPVIHFFRDDHLLLVVRDGLDELERRLAATPTEPQVIA